MTITLLMNSEGNKMGKTAKGAVWLDPNKTSPFEFYQYWRNVDDADVLKCGLVPSKGEARRLVQQGGVEVNGEKIKEVSSVITADQLAGEGLVIKKGKKVFHRAYLEG